MPLTKKGSEIMENMKEEYDGKKGEEVFYASKNAGTIHGVDDVANYGLHGGTGGGLMVNPTPKAPIRGFSGVDSILGFKHK